jgi:hypothetical protein
MADIMDAILARVRDQVPTLPEQVAYDDFSDDADTEVMIRHDVAPAVSRRYLTGSYWAGFNFSFYAKAQDGEEARALLEAVQGALSLDNALKLALGIAKGTIKTKTNPHYVGKTDRGARIYTSSYELAFFKEA